MDTRTNQLPARVEHSEEEPLSGRAHVVVRLALPLHQDELLRLLTP